MIVAVTGERATRLCRLLERAAWNPLSFRINGEMLQEMGDPGDLGVDAVLASADGGQMPQRSLVDAAMSLRTRYLYWGCIHLLLPRPELGLDLIDEWGIHLHALPPPDVRGLVDDIVNSEPFGAAQRRRITLGSLRALADDLTRIFPVSQPTPDQLKEAIRKVLEILALTPERSQFQSLEYALERVRVLPGLSESDRVSLQSIATSVEEQVREKWNQDRQQSALSELLVSLHHLNNLLPLLGPGRRQEPIAIGAARIAPQVSRLSSAMGKEISGLQALCDDIHGILRCIGEGTTDDSLRESLATQVSTLHAFVSERDPSCRTSRAAGAVERIVVVEDNPAWRETIHSILLGLGLPIPITAVGDLAAARYHLKHGGPALVLVDLGLPRNTGAVPEPDVGISLIREFSGTDQGVHFRHRFIVLTAATNYSAAVHETVRLGVSPTSYLHKNLEVCRAELPAQAWLALRPPPQALPRIEVLVSTGRVVRIEGWEIQLPRPLWCLLAAFAGGYFAEGGQIARRNWRTRATLAAILADSGIDSTMDDLKDAGLRQDDVVQPDREDEEVNGSDTNASQTGDTPDRLERRISDYVSKLRRELDRAYRRIHNHAPTMDFLETFENRYRLNAALVLLDESAPVPRPTRRPKVLVIEDNQHWRRSIVEGLDRSGLIAREAAWLEEAKNAILTDPPDLISLDLELPATEEEHRAGKCDSVHALDFVKFLSENAPDVPVAVLTGIGSRDSIMPKIIQAGVRAEDYIYKGSPEPITRLTTSLWRLWLEASTHIRILDWDEKALVHALHIDPIDRILVAVGSPSHPKALKVSGAGLSILKKLSERPNTHVTREALFDLVYPDTEKWGKDVENSFDLHISRLRKAIFDQTGIPGDQIVCGGPNGVYWLQGIPTVFGNCGEGDVQ